MRCGENGEGGEGVAVIVVGVRAVTGGGSQSLSLVDQITVHCMTIGLDIIAKGLVSDLVLRLNPFLKAKLFFFYFILLLLSTHVINFTSLFIRAFNPTV